MFSMSKIFCHKLPCRFIAVGLPAFRFSYQAALDRHILPKGKELISQVLLTASCLPILRLRFDESLLAFRMNTPAFVPLFALPLTMTTHRKSTPLLLISVATQRLKSKPPANSTTTIRRTNISPQEEHSRIRPTTRVTAHKDDPIRAS